MQPVRDRLRGAVRGPDHARHDRGDGSAGRVRIDRALYDLLAKKAEEKGYSSADEFILHVLEATVADAGPGATEEQVRKRLKGLGYLK